MALSINLLHEQKQEMIDRRQDPIKLAMLAGVVFLVVMVGYYFWRSHQLAGLKAKHNGLQARWTQQEPALANALEEEQVLRSKIEGANTLSKEVKERILWGPVLQSLMETTPREIQITSLEALAGTDTRVFQINLAGISAGEDPRDVAESYRRLLAERFAAQFPETVVEFLSLEEQSTEASLDGRRLPTARFQIQLGLKKP